jgi:hypothetical protein
MESFWLGTLIQKVTLADDCDRELLSDSDRWFV